MYSGLWKKSKRVSCGLCVIPEIPIIRRHKDIERLFFFINWCWQQMAPSLERSCKRHHVLFWPSCVVCGQFFHSRIGLDFWLFDLLELTLSSNCQMDVIIELITQHCCRSCAARVLFVLLCFIPKSLPLAWSRPADVFLTLEHLERGSDQTPSSVFLE